MAIGVIPFYSLAANEPQPMAGHVPRIVASGLVRPIDRLQSNRRLDLAIGLPLRNREELSNFLTQLYDPSSPGYRHFLTPQQFSERFGPTENDYQAILAFARSNHLVVTGTHPNKMILDVNAAAADVERAFHIQLRVYQHPNESRRFYAPDKDPSVEARIPVLSVSGLDDFYLPKPMDFRARFKPAGSLGRRLNKPASTQDANTGQPALDATGSGPTGTFLGRDFRSAYAPGLLLDGSGQSIGLLELDNYYREDISQYADLAGLPQVPLTNVLVNGFNRPPGPNNGEAALDIEMAISMAPGLSSVLVYEGSQANDILNRMATDNAARELSSSWSFGQPVDATRGQIFQQFAAQGQSFFQASGDDGAYGVPFPPADDPWVTSVGGTSLTTTGPLGAWVSETAWFGSGGGISANYPIPAWQQSLGNSSNQGSTTMRNVPDIAAQADATIWVIANNGEQGTVGGTSAAAPLWAGFAALVNQQAAANGQAPLGFLNPALYAIGRSPSSTNLFHDVSVGNNTNPSSPTRFFAVPGYDLCTGWGTPNGSDLLNALLAPVDTLQVSSAAELSFSGVVGGPFQPSSRTIWLTNISVSSLAWTSASSASWLTVLPAAGLLSPSHPSTNVTLRLAAGSVALPAGSYPATVWFTNLNDGFAQRRTVTLYAQDTPGILVQPANVTVPTGATAKFSVATGTNALLAFQWQANGVNLSNGANVSGANTAELTLLNVTLANNGSYSVTVTNTAGSAHSTDALLTVTSSPPVIVSQPASHSVFPGAITSLSVTAYGDPPLAYQWQRAGTNLVDSGNVSGSQSSTLILTQITAADAGTYSVLITNHLGSAKSVGALLEVLALTSPELVLETAHSFTGSADGAHPNSLTVGPGGVLYGSTQSGGAHGSGTLFQLSSNQLQTLYSFSGTNDGERPNGGLIHQANGQIVGTTFGGGTNGFGTIFRLSTNNLLTTLFAFDHTNGVLPKAGLTEAADGTLFGTAYEGGIFHYGTLFRLDAAGAFSVSLPFGSTNGAFPPSQLTLASDGKFYGTTYKGGTAGKGSVFSLTPTGLFTKLASFDGTNGAFPFASVTQSTDGTFYGATTAGGSFGLGNLFRMTPDGRVTNVYSFSGQIDGSHPRATLLQSGDGNFYGLTSDGGSFGFGTVFRLSPSGALTTIAQFAGFNGANPEAALIEAPDGSLYGSTQNGGPANAGVVFRLRASGSAPQITTQPHDAISYVGGVVQFSVASFGTAPLAYQWQKNGVNLNDGPDVSGSQSRVLTIQNLSLAEAGSYSVVVSNQFGASPSSPATLQVLSSPPTISLQPTNQTVSPGATVSFIAEVLGNFPLSYQWLRNGNRLSDSGNISGSHSASLLMTNVTEANNGTYTLLASNLLGNVKSSDAVLSVIPSSAPGTMLTTLYSFFGQTDGSTPSELLDGGDGWLYGTTPTGGSFSLGALFKLGTNGSFITLASFDITNGATPLAGLTLGGKNVFYGTTSAGGLNNAGTVFSFTPSGQLGTVYPFGGGFDGGAPRTKLTMSPEGALYGSTTVGGLNGWGTLFEIDAGGRLTNSYSFKAAVDGAAPGALLLSPEGDLLGLTPNGGVFTNGNFFRWKPGGTPANVYSFSGGIDGSLPVGGLVWGDDGSLYGATRVNSIRGFAFYGTLFKVTTNGVLTTLYSLNFTDGSYPAAGLVLANDGNFYGTTQQGGPNDFGTLFRMSPDGSVSTMVEFDGFNDGASPVNALVQGSDGNLYGTTSAGGPGGGGTVFRLVSTGPPVLTAQPLPQHAFTGGSADFSVAVSGAGPLSYQWQKNGLDLTNGLTIQGAGSRVLRLRNLSGSDAGSYSVLVTNALGFVQSASAILTVQAGPPTISAALQSNSTLLLSWSTISNRVYQLQSATLLQPTNWLSLGPPLTAVGSPLSSAQPIVPNAHVFYRVILLP